MADETASWARSTSRRLYAIVSAIPPRTVSAYSRKTLDNCSSSRQHPLPPSCHLAHLPALYLHHPATLLLIHPLLRSPRLDDARSNSPSCSSLSRHELLTFRLVEVQVAQAVVHTTRGILLVLLAPGSGDGGGGREVDGCEGATEVGRRSLDRTGSYVQPCSVRHDWQLRRGGSWCGEGGGGGTRGRLPSSSQLVQLVLSRQFPRWRRRLRSRLGSS
jgi:hypothetical protein